MQKKVEFDGRVWPALLDFNVKLDSDLTTKANFLSAAATVILFFVLNKVLSMEFVSYTRNIQLAWGILLVGSLFSVLTSMMVVLPKLRYFSSKERIKEDIFYYKNIMEHFSRKQYLAYIKRLPWDNDRIAQAYAHQIYSLATNIIPYKFRMLKIAGWILMFAIFASTIIFFL